MKPRHSNPFRAAALTSLSFAMSLASGHAADITKDGDADNLNTGLSWVGDTAPGTGDVAFWDLNSLGGTLTMGGDLSWLGIRIGSGYAGGTIAFNSSLLNTLILGGSGIDMSASAADLVLNTNVTLGAGQTWNVASSRSLTVGGTISGAFALTKSGAGTLVLTNTNTFNGGTTISDGTLQLNTGGSLGSGAITNNGALIYNVGETGGSTYTVANTINGTGSLAATAATGVSLAFSGAIGGTTALSSVSLTTNGTTVSGVGNKITNNITTTGNQTYNGYTFAGSVSGTTFKSNAGSISFNSDLTSNGFGTDTITVDTATGNGNVFFGNHISYNGNATGSSFRYNVIKVLNVNAGTGTVTLAGNADSWMGTMGGQINAGSIYLANNLTMSPLGGQLSSTMVFNGAVSGASNAGIIGGGSNDPGWGFPTNPGKWTFKNNLTLTGTVNTGTNAIVVFDDASTYTCSSAITGSGSLQKTGVGTRILSNANTYTGATTINGGTLNLSNADALGGSTFSGGAGSLVFDSSVSGHAFTFGGLSGSSALVLADNAGSPNAVALTVGGNNAPTTYSGDLSGTGGSLTKSGTGTLTLSGTNTYMGTTTVSNGTLQFSAPKSFYNSTAGGVTSGNAANLIVNSGATAAFNVGGASDFTSTDITTLLTASTGGVGFKSGSSLGLDTTNGNVNWATAFADTANGALGLTKLGGNTLTLSAASNTYTGNTTVAAGTLTVSGTLGGGNYAGNIANAGAVNFNGTGAQALTGQVNGAGTYNFKAGTVTLSGGGTGSSAVTLTSTAAGTTMAVTNGTYAFSSITLAQNADTAGYAATYNQSGGTVNVSGALFLGQHAGNGSNSITNTATITGGSLAVGTLVLYKWANSQVNISGGGAVTAGTLQIGWSDASPTGSFAVGNGTTAGTLAWGATSVGGTRSYTMALNNGKIKATAANASWISSTMFTTMAVMDSGGTVDNGGFAIGIAQNISHGGTNVTDGGLIFTGSGTTTLSGTNAYTGVSNVSTGVLNIQNNTALGTTANGTSVTSGAALQIQNNITVGAEVLTLNGTGISSDGALRNISGTNTYGGLITLGSATRINSDAGALALSNTGTITGAYALTVGGVSNTSIASIIGTGSGTLTKDGAGTLTLSGLNTYTGATDVKNGTLQLTGALALVTTLNLGNGTDNGKFILGGTGGAVNQTLADLTTTGTGTTNAVVGGNATVSTLTVNKASGSTTFSGKLGGVGTNENSLALTKDGAGTLILSGANTYTGATIVSNGVLNVTGTIAGASAITVNTGGTLNFSLPNGATIANSALIAGGTLKLDYGVKGLTYSGNITGTSGTLNLAGSGISGSAGLTLTGNNTFSGNIQIDGTRIFLNSATNNALSGANIIFKTGWWPYHDMTLMQNEQIADTSVLKFETTNSTLYELRINGKTETVGGLQCTNELAIIENAGHDGGNDTGIAAGKLIVNVADGASYSYNGSLRNENGGGNGALSFEKKGLGTQILTRDISYTGATTVSEGTLKLTSTTGFVSAVSLNAGVLAFESGSLGTGTVTMNGGTLRWESGNTQNIATKLTLVNAKTATFDTNGNDVAFATAIGNSTGASLTKIGVGMLTLSNANTYTGATTVNNGTLKLIDAASFASSGVTMNGGTFELNRTTGTQTFTQAITAGIGTGNLVKSGAGTVVLTNANTYTGTTTISGGTLQIGDAGTVGTLGIGAVTNNATLTFNRTDNYGGNVGNAISGTGAVNISGGTLTLSGTNTYTGATTISAGTLTVSGSLSGTAISVTGGTFNATATNSLTGATSLLVSGGTAVLSSANNRTGATTVNSGGTLRLTHAGAMTGSAFTIGSDWGGALQLRGDTDTTFSASSIVIKPWTGALTIDVNQLTGAGSGKTLSLGASTLVENFTQGLNVTGGNGYTLGLGAVSYGNSNPWFNPTTANLAIASMNHNDTSSRTIILDGTATGNTLGTVGNGTGGVGAVNIEKRSSGTWTLTGTNTNTGNTTINASGGTLQFAKANSFYNSTAGSVSAGNAAKLTVNMGSTAAFNVGADTEFTAADIGTLLGASNGTVGFKTGSILGIDTTNAGGSFTYSSNLVNPTGSTSLGLTKLGTGTLILSGTNSYTGTTLISAGTLQIGAGGTAGTLGTGAVTNNGALTFNRTDTYGGNVSNNISGTGTVTQSGSGTLTLSGTNTYTGTTTINGGKLVVSGSIGNSAVTVNNIGTVLSSGATGNIGSSVTVNSGAILAAGDVGVTGTATVGSGGSTFNSDSIFQWDLNATNGADPGLVANSGTYDHLAVTGNLGGSGAVFNVVLGGNSFADAFWNTNKSWADIFTAANSFNLGAIFTTFSGTDIASNGTVTGQGSFTINGTSLTWTAVPEPTSALAGLLLGAGLLRRRRK